MADTAVRSEAQCATRARVLLAAAALHTCNDAFFAMLYPLLPFIASDLSLTYAEVGLVKAAFSASSGVLQLPAGMLAERWGEYLLLVWGNGWVAAGLLGMAAAATFPILLAATILAGLGGNLQHPLAASMVARAYEGGRRGTAIGTLNFAGDLGKMAAPVLAALVTLTWGWRWTLILLGLFGLVFSLGVGLAKGWVQPPSRSGVRDRGVLEHDDFRGSADEASSPHPNPLPAGEGALPPAFWMLGLVGMLDSSTRAAALTFLPFAFEYRGIGSAEIGLLFGVVFAGGAAGKFLCGPLGDRFGPFAVVVATEATTALALIGLIWGPTEAALGLALVFGFGLNGTSSVLYAAVATLVPEGRRGRGYGLYYTGVDVAAALAALAYGVVADRSGLSVTFAVMAALTLAIIPLAVPIRERLRG